MAKIFTLIMKMGVVVVGGGGDDENDNDVSAAAADDDDDVGSQYKMLGQGVQQVQGVSGPSGV